MKTAQDKVIYTIVLIILRWARNLGIDLFIDEVETLNEYMEDYEKDKGV